MTIQDARALPQVAQEDLRKKAVKAVLEGERQAEVARILGVSRQAVSQWVKTYRERGEQGLKARKRGRKGGTRLLPWQATQIAKAIMDRHPEQLKLPFYLWTRKAVVELIEKRFGIGLSVWTVGRYLRSWGFTPQKPTRKAFEQNPERVAQWLAVEYPRIRQKAKMEKAEIYWGDEMGLRSDHAAGRTYGLRGKTPVVFGTGNRFGCNMISAVTNRGQLNFMVFKTRFTAKVFMDFLKRLVRQAKRFVYLIVDRHPVHRSGEVQGWITQQSTKIRLFFLPGYSPELNPDELLNQDVKANAFRKKAPQTKNEMAQQVRSYLFSRQRKPDLIKKYFREEHVRYAAV